MRFRTKGDNGLLYHYIGHTFFIEKTYILLKNLLQGCFDFKTLTIVLKRSAQYLMKCGRRGLIPKTLTRKALPVKHQRRCRTLQACIPIHPKTLPFGG